MPAQNEIQWLSAFVYLSVLSPGCAGNRSLGSRRHLESTLPWLCLGTRWVTLSGGSAPGPGLSTWFIFLLCLLPSTEKRNVRAPGRLGVALQGHRPRLGKRPELPEGEENGICGLGPHCHYAEWRPQTFVTTSDIKSFLFEVESREKEGPTTPAL